jgi:DNA-binding XRE family transcriptional regulator
MPYLSEKITIAGSTNDRRIKLTQLQKKEIFENKLGLSQRKLATMYEVSRRTISFILFPEKLEENKKRREERGGSKAYYKKEKHTAYIREHRRYKQDLLISGEIKLPAKKKKENGN